ncbi:tripartite tricarboxylate transporter substrate-binding protein [Dankookia sp. GCM10030260]|uniref:tripartite tricarboxylate transporter substrate-binding protein n=1 Tax=Dankookia sp. GCM10030260 TaxID=3273390 RepID=UPI003608F944
MASEPAFRPGRRRLGALAGLALAAPALSRPARAASAPVTLLVGAAPGSTADAWARGFAPFLERHLPRTAIAVLNRPGERGLAAARAVAGAPPDGRLLAAVAVPQLLARSIELRAEPLLTRLDFMAAVTEEPLVLVGLAGTTDDLDALRGLGPQAVLGTPPHGSAAQLAAVALGQGLPLDLLAFASAPAARQAVLAGNAACALLPLPEAIAALRDGRLSGLALARTRRSDLLPEVPTFAEQGIPLQSAAYRGFAVPAGTGQAALAPLLAALEAVVVDPEFVDQSQARGSVPRFIGQRAWEPMLRRTLAELGERWVRDPWTSRHD